APEGEGGQLVAEQACLTGALHHVIRRREQRAAAKGEDHRIGMQRTQAPVAEPGNIEVELRPYELRGDQHADGHAHYAPDDRHDSKLPDDLVVERLESIGSITAINHGLSPS